MRPVLKLIQWVIFSFIISSCQTGPSIRSCFSPDENCDNLIVSAIQRAQSDLDIAIFDLTHPKIVHEILVASKRIKVRVLVDERQSKGQHSLVSTLIRAGLDVRAGKQRGIMHNKFMIIDGRELETGSFNFSVGASVKNQENQIYIENSEIVKKFQNRFDKMWSEANVL